MIGQQPTFLPEAYRTLSVEEMEARVREIRAQLGTKLFIPGHHYQKDEVIQFADSTGDSLQLAQVAASNKEAEHIVFCGVHFSSFARCQSLRKYLADCRGLRTSAK